MSPWTSIKILLLKPDSDVPDYTRESLRRAKAPDLQKEKDHTASAEATWSFRLAYELWKII
jgi:hypothetical protein